MTSRTSSLAILTLGLATVAGCDPDGRPAAGSGPGGPALSCIVFLRVAETEDVKGHMQVGGRLRMSGPQNAEGDYRLHPIGPDIEWLPKSYDMINVSAASPPTDYRVYVEVQAPGKHNQVSPHVYDATVQYGNDGCPQEVDFESTVDISATGEDHAGHAHTVR